MRVRRGEAAETLQLLLEGVEADGLACPRNSGKLCPIFPLPSSTAPHRVQRDREASQVIWTCTVVIARVAQEPTRAQRNDDLGGHRGDAAGHGSVSRTDLRAQSCTPSCVVGTASGRNSRVFVTELPHAAAQTSCRERGPLGVHTYLFRTRATRKSC